MFNSQMHPRNIYRKPPDFAKLACEDAELRKHCTLGFGGKVRINFDSDAAVRALTRTLLSHDFKLDVHLPEGSLCPRVPQRLNYLLWIDDQLKASGISREDVVGIDIGTGSSCIFPLLGVRSCEWRAFLATETSADSLADARANVARNLLQDRIEVLHVGADEGILAGVLTSRPNSSFTFCMCNPPFFDSGTDIEKRFMAEPKGKWKNRRNGNEEKGREQSHLAGRRDKRSAPRSATHATTGELAVEGGESAFIAQLIEESKQLRGRIKLYTTMLGKRSSVNLLTRILISLRASDDSEIAGLRYSVATLNQGYTQRWLLAWTYCNDIKLPDDSVVLPLTIDFAISDPEIRIRAALEDLKIRKDEKNDAEEDEYVAEERSWLRRKRRHRDNGTIEEGNDELQESQQSSFVLRFSLSHAARDTKRTCLFKLIQGEKTDLNCLVQYLGKAVNVVGRGIEV